MSRKHHRTMTPLLLVEGLHGEDLLEVEESALAGLEVHRNTVGPVSEVCVVTGFEELHGLEREAVEVPLLRLSFPGVEKREPAVLVEPSTQRIRGHQTSRCPITGIPDVIDHLSEAGVLELALVHVLRSIEGLQGDVAGPGTGLMPSPARYWSNASATYVQSVIPFSGLNRGARREMSVVSNDSTGIGVF
ncbi:hypothetical protein ABZ202_26390 [Streptomyces sp. NPDC006186]|uniref:hypothetical protein n=1 Tax=Streptomyces sp. NPDC006186 TaxID=3155248 RepID=UPI0033BC319D